MTAVTPEPIIKVAMGFMAAKHLFVASEVGLFEALAAGPATIEELASRTGVPSRTIAIAVAAMVSLGLIEQDGDRYQNGEPAAAFLAGKLGPDLRPMLRFFDQISYPTWQKLADAVRTGNGQAQYGKFDKRQQEIFSAGVESFSGPGAAALATNYDFGRHRKVLDVAGGTGSFLVAVLKRHANLRGTLFELPGPCAIARQQLANVPEGSRIEVIEGDAFRDPLPADHDALIVANTAPCLLGAAQPRTDAQDAGRRAAGRTAVAGRSVDRSESHPAGSGSFDIWRIPRHFGRGPSL
jgi:O-methyltransferase domain/Dimerisation domain